MKLKIIIGLIALFILSAFVLAGDYQVDENMNLLGNDVYNATNINGTNVYQDGNKALDVSGFDGSNVTSGTVLETYLPSSLYTVALNGSKVDVGTIGESYLPSSLYTIALNGSKVDTGIVAESYLPSSLYTISINGSKVDTGIVAESYLPSSLYTIALNGSKIDIGTIAEAKIEDKFLKNYGDTSTGHINMSGNDLLGLGQLKDSSTIEKIGNGNLAGFWNFDNTSYVNSGLTLDSSINANDGTITGAILTTGKYGQGYEFDGVDDSINCGNDISLNLHNTITISAWINLKSLSTHSSLVLRGAIRFRVQDSASLWVYDGVDSLFGGTINLNEWTHVVFVGNSSGKELFINGVSVASDAVAWQPASSSSNFYIGSRIVDEYFNGTIDEMMIFDTSLSANEVQALYSQGSHRLDPYFYKSGSNIKEIRYVEVGNGNDIQTKIDECGTTGCLIMIPNGDYYINDTITISQKSITLKGNSFGGGKYNTQGSVRIIADSGMTGKNMINITNERIILKNIIFDGNNITLNGIGMYPPAGSILIQDVQTKNQGRNGIFSANDMGAGNLLFHVISSENGLHGVESERNDWMITDYYSFRNWNGAALMLNDGGGCQVVSMHAFKNKYCIYMNGTDASSFTNIESEQNNVSVYYFDSSHSDINRISIKGGIHYLNNYDNLTGTIFNFDADTNDINGVTITGTTIDGSTPVFNYSETNGGKIKEIRFSDNIYESDLGDYPNVINFGVGMDISNQGMVSGMNFNTESIIGASGSEIIFDSSSKNNHATNNGALHNTSNSFNDGGSFDFTNDYISINDNDNLDFGMGDFTISMWAKGTYTTNYHNLLHKRSAYQDGEIEFKFWGDGSLEFSTDNTANGGADVRTRDTSYFLTDNRWYHIIGMRKNDTLYTYVDGKEISSNSGTIQNITNTGDIFIGSGIGGHYFNGSIDEVGIWNRALSDDEIEAMFIQKREVINSYISQTDISVDSDGNAEIYGIFEATEFYGVSNWTYNQNYPAACSSGYAITALGDSTTCTDSWVNAGGDSMTGNLAMGDKNITGVNELSSTLIDTTNLEADNLESNLDGTGYNFTINKLTATLISAFTALGNIAMGGFHITGAGDVNATGKGNFATINTGQGDLELYDRLGDLITTSPIAGAANDVFYGTDADLINLSIVADSIGNAELEFNTGQGLTTDDDVTHNNVTATNRITAAEYFSGANQGITDTSSYWLCADVDCNSTCQVAINDGLITGCT